MDSDSLSQPMVIKTLFEACSQDPLVLKQAESRLKIWEVMPGFYSVVAVSLTTQ